MDSAVEFVESGQEALDVPAVFKGQELFMVLSYFLPVGEQVLDGFVKSLQVVVQFGGTNGAFPFDVLVSSLVSKDGTYREYFCLVGRYAPLVDGEILVHGFPPSSELGEGPVEGVGCFYWKVFS